MINTQNNNYNLKEKQEFQKKVAFAFYAYGSKSIDKMIFYGSKQFTINDFKKINNLRIKNGLEPLEFWDMFDSGVDYIGDDLKEPEEDKDISKVLVP